jgi:hypothetical protein
MAIHYLPLTNGKTLRVSVTSRLITATMGKVVRTARGSHFDLILDSYAHIARAGDSATLRAVVDEAARRNNTAIVRPMTNA